MLSFLSHQELDQTQMISSVTEEKQSEGSRVTAGPEAPPTIKTHPPESQEDTYGLKLYLEKTSLFKARCFSPVRPAGGPTFSHSWLSQHALLLRWRGGLRNAVGPVLIVPTHKSAGFSLHRHI